MELVVTVSSLRPNMNLMPHLEPLADLGSEDLSCPRCSGSPNFIHLKQPAFDRETFTNFEGKFIYLLKRFLNA